MYSKELESIKKSNRFRTREIFDENLIDLASNDYLGLSINKNLFQKAYKKVLTQNFHSPRASMLVNGYTLIHKEFEDKLCEVNNFESAITVGSGFLANISMIEALVRKNDILFIDEEYHASGILATKLLKPEQVIIFKHNDFEDLENKILQNDKIGRKIIAIEGVYSMGGDLAPIEIFQIADKYKSLLIVDEAHSSGVIGENLLGIFDYYKIKPNEYHIKMGTLGKAYGSYGAYILASKQIIDFLTNRAKPIIYSTAPSLFDIALANESLQHIINNKKNLKKQIEKNLQIIYEILKIKSNSLIIPIEIGNNKKVKEIQEILKEKGYLVGAIRQPTVKSAIIRLIAKIDVNEKDLIEICNLLRELNVNK
ncbi:aminotransferase class I/II-fold pyridoxal phosphate-dependent enzyme [Arcobacter aquimarinus]|uniref:8-amino-7-oxononanoate synthase n=1 Tax=Arcobacter aquimarinus TaxID=1315211 RepID=A0AAE7E137_9BACT|nr:pyridoxal phosphate-dependent aminotransferase family protein [Arcobacter aquimarinus]QKE25091.1 8-amino-7-oxononanoate synthase [Arcobacter aquimarinus]RXI36456.1 8-amino-7-oxononanoate synthase [Arcobacter aquimarinus]